MIGHEENETCGRDGCDGVMEWSENKPDGCYCHASPPCELCVNDPLRCSKCGEASGTGPDAPAEPTTPTAPPDAIARQMGPEVTAWIAGVMREWSEAREQVEELRWTADNNAAQVETLATELTAARKRLAEVANHVDPSVLASVNAELAQSRKALADTFKELVESQQQAKNREEEVNAWVAKATTADALRDRAYVERDAATKRAQIAEGELTKTRQLYFGAERRAEIAEAALAGATSDFHKAKHERDAAFARTTELQAALSEPDNNNSELRRSNMRMSARIKQLVETLVKIGDLAKTA